MDIWRFFSGHTDSDLALCHSHCNMQLPSGNEALTSEHTQYNGMLKFGIHDGIYIGSNILLFSNFLQRQTTRMKHEQVWTEQDGKRDD